MKKNLFPLVCLALFCMSCNNASKPVVTTDTPAAGNGSSPMAQKNLDAMHVVDKAFATGDVSGLDSVLATNFVDHTENGDMNADSLKAGIKSMHASGKPMKMEMIKELADDEYAFAVMHYTGTGGAGTGMPDGPYDMHAIELVKFSNGKATEHWSYLKASEVMQMMHAMMPGKDKMKMMDKGKKK
jgi:predicted SnoaL-like aldol condensation-catalyzing enzyme